MASSSFVVEQATTVAELLRQVVAVGRATLGSVDGTFGVVRDILQTVPVGGSGGVWAADFIAFMWHSR
jgi:hypothetical protein